VPRKQRPCGTMHRFWNSTIAISDESSNTTPFLNEGLFEPEATFPKIHCRKSVWNGDRSFALPDTFDQG
ncbi:MAG TPA: hypothetical protein VMY18_03790, partial [Acidobacteriota bacterium]|nr:hypothetical protein [Acidobacteriota bacterium]